MSWIAMIKAIIAPKRAPVAMYPERSGRANTVSATFPAEDEATTERGLRIAGVTNSLPSTVAFYESMGSQFINYRELIRSGPLLTTDEKKILGIRTRAYVGSHFVMTLNEKGLSDVQEAAGRIAFTLNRQRDCINDLHRDLTFSVGKLRFFPSNMAAGPCAPARDMSTQLVRPEHAPLLPFDGCEHPDQCACRYFPDYAERSD